MSRVLGASELVRLTLNEAHQMHLRHELMRVQCEHAGEELAAAAERVEAARWKGAYEALCEALEIVRGIEGGKTILARNPEIADGEAAKQRTSRMSRA